MIDSLQSFLQALRLSRLLSPVQLNDLKSTALPADTDPDSLALNLVRRGWLTAYQAEHLLEGRDQELVLGPYRLLNLLGEGGLCQVYKAWHADARRIVALKVLHPELRSNQEVLQQLRQEMEVIARLNHPAFIQAVDVQLEGGTEGHYFAMEFVDGIDLNKLLRQSGSLPVAQTCDFIRQAAVGLQYAFEQGLVHRDIKPANILVTYESGQVKILDIGLARLEWSFADEPVNQTPTSDGMNVMGTPDYIAPEQALDAETADTRADIYSLGCTLFHLLAGEPPFPGNSLARKLLQHQQAPRPSLRAKNPDVPAELDAVVQKMMAIQPTDRPKTPLAVSVALAPFCESDEARIDLMQFRPDDTPAEILLRESGRQEVESPRPPLPETPAIPWGTPGGPERRAHPRRGGNPIPVLVLDPLRGGEALRGWVLNRSPGGLGLYVEEALEIGTQVQVRPDGPQFRSMWFAVRVIYCFKERLRWRVGCQFVEKLSWDTLRHFG